MAKTKEQLEEEINKSKYFSLNGDNIGALRKTEERKLFGNVFDYCKLYFFPDKQSAMELGYEIYTICRKCIKNYDIKQGFPFLHYFIKSLDNEKRRLRIREKRENGRHKPFTDFEKPMNEGNLNIEDTFTDSKNSDIEDALIQKSNIQELFDKIEAIFKSRQDRVKQYLKKLLTIKYFDSISALYTDGNSKKYAFIDYELFEKYKYGGNIPTQKEIAESLGKVEQDASRTIAKFERLVSAQIKK